MHETLLPNAARTSRNIGVWCFNSLIYLRYLLLHIAVTEKFNSMISRQEKLVSFSNLFYK